MGDANTFSGLLPHQKYPAMANALKLPWGLNVHLSDQD